MGLNFDLHSIQGRHELLAGLDLQKEKLKDSFFRNRLTGSEGSFVVDPKYQHSSSENYSLFLQDIYHFDNRNIELTLGGRYDFVDPFDDQFSLRAGLTHKFSQRWFYKLLFGTAYRSPSLVEYVRAPVGLPLPDVEKMKTFELQLGFKGEDSYYSLTAFHNNFDDLISRKNSLFGNEFEINLEQFGNLDDQTMYGLEFESRFQLSRRLSGFLNVSWLNTESDSTGEDIPLLAEWTLSAGLGWSKNIGIGRLLFHNDIVVFDERRDWPDEVWSPGQPQRHSGRDRDFADGFIVWNCGLHYLINRVAYNKIDLSLTIKNVLNEDYYTQSSTVPDANQPASWDAQYDQRHWRFAVRYSW